MKFHKAFLVLFLFLVMSGFAQDLSFEDANQSLVNLNPSFTGSNKSLRLQNYYRNQWPNTLANSVTYHTCADVYFKAIKGGLAFTASAENQSKGFLKTQQYGVSYAQHCAFKDGKLKVIPSFQLSYVQVNLDVDNLPSPSPSPYSPPVSVKKGLDVSSGLLINYNSFFIGGTVKHINQPDFGLTAQSDWPPLLRLHSSYTKKLNAKNLVQAIVIFNGQRNFRQLIFGTNAVVANYFLVGLNYYNLDAMTVNMGYRNSYVSAKVGYTAVVSKLAGNTYGAWHLACAFAFVKPGDRNLLQNFETW